MVFWHAMAEWLNVGLVILVLCFEYVTIVWLYQNQIKDLTYWDYVLHLFYLFLVISNFFSLCCALNIYIYQLVYCHDKLKFPTIQMLKALLIRFLIDWIYFCIFQKELETGDGPIGLILAPTRELSQQVKCVIDNTTQPF